MLYAFAWFLASIVCYFHLFCDGADLNFRLHSPSIDDGFWKFHAKFYREGFRLLTHDYFGVYCPWSWERAKHFRLADMREYLGEEGRAHQTLGKITRADCDDPSKQEAIARLAYISRTKQWVIGLCQFVLSPVSLLVLVVFAISVGIVGVIMTMWNFVQG